MAGCSGSELSRGSALAHHHERRPEGRMRLARLALVDEREHGAAQRLGAADGLSRGELAHGAGDELHGASEFTSQCETSSARACA